MKSAVQYGSRRTLCFYFLILIFSYSCLGSRTSRMLSPSMLKITTHDHDRNTWVDHQPWCFCHVSSSLVQHQSPFRCRRCSTKTKEGQGCQLQHHGSDICCCSYYHLSNHVRENMYKQNLPVSWFRLRLLLQYKGSSLLSVPCFVQDGHIWSSLLLRWR